MGRLHIQRFAEIAVTNTSGNFFPGSFSKVLRARQSAPAPCQYATNVFRHRHLLPALLSALPHPMQVGLSAVYWLSGSVTLWGDGLFMGINIP